MRRTLIILIIILAFSAGCADDSEFVNKETITITSITEAVCDVFMKPDIFSEKAGQCLFNERVEITEEHDKWLKIKNDRVSGFIMKACTTSDEYFINEINYKQKIVVTGRQQYIYSNKDKSIILKKVRMGTVLYSKNRVENLYEVDLPGKIKGWIMNKDIIVIKPDEEIYKTTAYDLAGTTKRLKGVKYIEKGISTSGIDNTGFIKICLFLNGINWDGNIKSLEKYEKVKEDYKAGDILYISNIYNKDFYELAIYLENDEFILASKRKGYVTLERTENLLFTERIEYAIRVLD
jgi:hypothetical protein